MTTIKEALDIIKSSAVDYFYRGYSYITDDGKIIFSGATEAKHKQHSLYLHRCGLEVDYNPAYDSKLLYDLGWIVIINSETYQILCGAKKPTKIQEELINDAIDMMKGNQIYIKTPKINKRYDRYVYGFEIVNEISESYN